MFCTFMSRMDNWVTYKLRAYVSAFLNHAQPNLSVDKPTMYSIHTFCCKFITVTLDVTNCANFAMFKSQICRPQTF